MRFLGAWNIPLEVNMEPKHQPIEKEDHLNQTSFQMWIFPGGSIHKMLDPLPQISSPQIIKVQMYKLHSIITNDLGTTKNQRHPRSWGLDSPPPGPNKRPERIRQKLERPKVAAKAPTPSASMLAKLCLGWIWCWNQFSWGKKEGSISHNIYGTGIFNYIYLHLP